MTTRALVIATVLAVCCAPSAAGADTVAQRYREGLQHYYGGRYQQAVEGFERLVALPLHHEELFYNLGCAYFRLGQLGPAIYNFERALALDSSFEDARFNLEYSRRLAAKRIKDVLKGVDGERWWVSLAKRLSLNSWWALFIVLWWLLLGILFGLRFVQPGPGRAGLIAANSFVAVLTVACGLLLAARITLARGVPQGIILPDKVAVREGPDASARSTFKLHAGLKVRLQAESAGWVRIRLPNGLEGWIDRRKVGRL